jgi:CHAD domain-containing protein
LSQVKQTLEREIKLRAEPGFRLPDLPGEPLIPRTFTSTYHDTADHRLARQGVTLRHRVEGPSELWQLKLPAGGARLELEQPGGGDGPPAEMTDLLVASLREGALRPVATLETLRSGILVREHGLAVAEVAVDRVTVLVEEHPLRRFEELEVELLDGGDEDALRQIEQALRAAGAVDGDGRPKVFQALGLDVPGRAPRPPSKASPLEHLAAMLWEQYAEIVAHDPGTRLGNDIEALHQHRVAVRRLRALLRAARPLVDAEWAQSLRAELKWLGGALGPVRDLDVMREHLREEAASLEDHERAAFDPLLADLEAERETARGKMLEALRDPAYTALLERLERELPAPPPSGADTELRDLAAREHRRLRKAVRGVGDAPSDEQLHAIRILVKRARYAAELAEGAVGRPAARFVARSKTLQDVLGDHQDAVVAEERLRGLLAAHPGTASAFAVGRLVERQRARRTRARAAFPRAWRALHRAGREAWS